MEGAPAAAPSAAPRENFPYTDAGVGGGDDALPATTATATLTSTRSASAAEAAPPSSSSSVLHSEFDPRRLGSLLRRRGKESRDLERWKLRRWWSFGAESSSLLLPPSESGASAASASSVTGGAGEGAQLSNASAVASLSAASSLPPALRPSTGRSWSDGGSGSSASGSGVGVDWARLRALGGLSGNRSHSLNGSGPSTPTPDPSTSPISSSSSGAKDSTVEDAELKSLRDPQPPAHEEVHGESVFAALAASSASSATALSIEPSSASAESTSQTAATAAAPAPEAFDGAGSSGDSSEEGIDAGGAEEEGDSSGAGEGHSSEVEEGGNVCGGAPGAPSTLSPSAGDAAGAGAALAAADAEKVRRKSGASSSSSLRASARPDSLAALAALARRHLPPPIADGGGGGAIRWHGEKPEERKTHVGSHSVMVSNVTSQTSGVGEGDGDGSVEDNFRTPPSGTPSSSPSHSDNRGESESEEDKLPSRLDARATRRLDLVEKRGHAGEGGFWRTLLIRNQGRSRPAARKGGARKVRDAVADGEEVMTPDTAEESSNGNNGAAAINEEQLPTASWGPVPTKRQVTDHGFRRATDARGEHVPGNNILDRSSSEDEVRGRDDYLLQLGQVMGGPRGIDALAQHQRRRISANGPRHGRVHAHEDEDGGEGGGSCGKEDGTDGDRAGEIIVRRRGALGFEPSEYESTTSSLSSSRAPTAMTATLTSRVGEDGENASSPEGSRPGLAAERGKRRAGKESKERGGMGQNVLAAAALLLAAAAATGSASPWAREEAARWLSASAAAVRADLLPRLRIAVESAGSILVDAGGEVHRRLSDGMSCALGVALERAALVPPHLARLRSIAEDVVPAAVDTAERAAVVSRSSARWVRISVVKWMRAWARLAVSLDEQRRAQRWFLEARRNASDVANESRDSVNENESCLGRKTDESLNPVKHERDVTESVQQHLQKYPLFHTEKCPLIDAVGNVCTKLQLPHEPITKSSKFVDESLNELTEEEATEESEMVINDVITSQLVPCNESVGPHTTPRQISVPDMDLMVDKGDSSCFETSLDFVHVRVEPSIVLNENVQETVPNSNQSSSRRGEQCFTEDIFFVELAQEQNLCCSSLLEDTFGLGPFFLPEVHPDKSICSLQLESVMEWHKKPEISIQQVTFESRRNRTRRSRLTPPGMYDSFMAIRCVESTNAIKIGTARPVTAVRKESVLSASQQGFTREEHNSGQMSRYIGVSTSVGLRQHAVLKGLHLQSLKCNPKDTNVHMSQQRVVLARISNTLNDKSFWDLHSAQPSATFEGGLVDKHRKGLNFQLDPLTYSELSHFWQSKRMRMPFLMPFEVAEVDAIRFLPEVSSSDEDENWRNKHSEELLLSVEPLCFLEMMDPLFSFPAQSVECICCKVTAPHFYAEVETDLKDAPLQHITRHQSDVELDVDVTFDIPLVDVAVKFFRGWRSRQKQKAKKWEAKKQKRLKQRNRNRRHII